MGGRSFLFNRWLLSLSVGKKLFLVVGIMATITAVGLIGLWFGMRTLSDMRALVGGEGLWSKSQKEAVLSLQEYAASRDETEYHNFLTFLKVPLGDRQARLELERTRPDYSRVYQGFIQGRNSPRDVRNIAIFLRRYHRIPYVRKAIGIWTEGDRLISLLQEQGNALHELVSSGTASKGRIRSLLSEIDATNDQLTIMEDNFSYTLGAASRWTDTMLFYFVFGFTLAIGTPGLLISIFISRAISGDIRKIRDGALRVAAGDYSGKLCVRCSDEIGLLADAFNNMTGRLADWRESLVRRAAEVEEVNRKLIETEKIKDDFFANVSHELRTPLTLLLSPLESLLSGEYGRLEENQRKVLEGIHNNSMRLLRMVNGLLDFSKFEAGKMEVKREPVELVSLTRAILEDFRPLMEQRGLQRAFHSSVSHSLMMMDRYLYERILFNLLSNAVKFTQPGGRISVGFEAAHDRVKVSVSDTGIGIADNDLKHLFQKFSQLEGSATRRFEGTGLGLALVKEFCGILLGSVSVKSAKREGSTFTVELPAPACVEAQGEVAGEKPVSLVMEKYTRPGVEIPSSTKLASDGSSPKVLVVEDNLELASYIRELVADFCQVRIAGDGAQALELAEGWKPDLILSDIMLPGMDGLTLCKRIKSGGKSAVPFILLTALTHREALIKGWEAGADEYLFKPFHPRELVTRIRSMLSARLEQRKVEQMRKDFVAFAAHQLKTPVSEVSGYIDNILSGLTGEINNKQKDYLLKMQRISQGNIRLIADLLSVSQIERGMLLPNLEPVELKEIVHYAVRDLGEAIRKKGLSLQMNEIGEKAIVLADIQKAVEAIRNVVDNAVQYTDHGSIIVEIRVENGFGVVEVTDTGAGISEPILQKLFTKELILQVPWQKRGSGLGLYIASNFMKLQNGDVSVSSTIGQGSRFTFRIPQFRSANSPRLLQV